MPARVDDMGAGVRVPLVRPAIVALLGAALLGLTAACEPTLHQQTGIVLRVDSPALGRVDSFELLTTDGERLVFDTTELGFRPEFPAPHLSEHQVLGDQILVTYKQDGDRLLVTKLDDAQEGPGH